MWLSRSRWPCRRSSGVQAGGGPRLPSSAFAPSPAAAAPSRSGSSGPGTCSAARSWLARTSSIKGRASSSWPRSFRGGFGRSDFQEDLQVEAGFRLRLSRTPGREEAGGAGRHLRLARDPKSRSWGSWLWLSPYCYLYNSLPSPEICSLIIKHSVTLPGARAGSDRGGPAPVRPAVRLQ